VVAVREAADPRAVQLCTIPRVGRIAALTFLAAVDNVGRFGSSRQLVSYAGLCPSVRSSGERTEYGSINREGRRELRAVWVQIAHSVVRMVIAVPPDCDDGIARWPTIEARRQPLSRWLASS